MKLILRPTSGPDDWKQFLAEPEKQWKEGYSAHSLAHCWELANGLPESVRAVFQTSLKYRHIEPLLAIPEVRVDLPGGARPSQTDLWLLARVPDGLVSVAVEGKVSETFGPTVAEWQTAASAGKTERLEFLLEVLHLEGPIPPELRYQLLHRTASAILLARRFHARYAVMMVHSFSRTDVGLEDYQAFLRALGTSAQAGQVVDITSHSDPTLSLAWVAERGAYVAGMHAEADPVGEDAGKKEGDHMDALACKTMLKFWSERVRDHGDIVLGAVDTLERFQPEGGFEALKSCLIEEVARRIRQHTTQG